MRFELTSQACINVTTIWKGLLKLKIKKIYIKNFKCINKLEIQCDEDFNVIIGQNNIGKTTILESILLWKKCYDISIQKSDNKFYASAKNLNFKELDFLRISDDVDLFNCVIKKKAQAEICLEIKNNNETYKLGFLITKVYNISNAYFQMSYENKDDFKAFEALALCENAKLSNMIVVSQSRPIASIISKEPYMYKSQVLAKITQGKGYEVLRNKIRYDEEKKIKIENSISRILNNEYKFIEKNKDNKEYIKMLVEKNGKTSDLLSQGSGFLQLAEIFSSLEYVEAKLNVVLIDEPDAHLHVGVQKKLIQEFDNIENSQIFIISHNENFLYTINEDKILWMNHRDINNGFIKHIPNGSKKFVASNLVDELSDLEHLKYTNIIILVEGYNDKLLINKIIEKYWNLKNTELEYRVQPMVVELKGIDALQDKLSVLFSAYSDLVGNEVNWLLIRDTDCLPISKIGKLKVLIEKAMPIQNKKILIQDGYEFESVYFSNIEKLNRIINMHYEIEMTILNGFVAEILGDLEKRIKNVTDPLYMQLEIDYKRQIENRKEKFYKESSLSEILQEINTDNIQYVMTKKNIDEFLKNLHEKITTEFENNNKSMLSNSEISDYYILSIANSEDFYIGHKELLDFVYDSIYND